MSDVDKRINTQLRLSSNTESIVSPGAEEEIYSTVQLTDSMCIDADQQGKLMAQFTLSNDNQC